MTPYERDVLNEIAEPGSVKGLRSGAAIMAALEWLQEQGYVTRGSHPKITDKGREAMMSDYRIEAATKEEWAERAFAAEERLAKAMMALEGLLRHEPDWPSSVWVNARTIITEIKGGKDDWSNVWPNVDDFYRPLPRKEKKDENENDTPTTSE